MITNILDSIGLPYRETRFKKPPTGSYIVYHDAIEAGGADGFNAIKKHKVTLELFNPTTESSHLVQTILDANGVEWEKDFTEYEEQVQSEYSLYYFNFIEKRGAKL